MTGRTVVRRLRRDGRGLRLAYVGLVLAVSALACVAPVILAGAADHTLRAEITRADDATRTVTVRQVVPFRGWRANSGASERVLQTTQQALLAGMSVPLRRIVTAGTYGAQTAAYSVTDARTGERPDPQSRQKLLLRAQSAALDRVDWLRGVAPHGYTPISQDGEAMPRVEVALAADVAAALHVDVGDQLMLTPERFDRRIAVEVTGLFSPKRADPGFWAAEARVLVPDVVQTANSTIITGVALFPASLIGVVDAGAAQSLEIDYRFPLVVDRLSSESAADAVVALGAFTAFVRQDVGPNFDAGSGLPAAVAAFQAEMSTTTALLSIAVVGLATVALAAETMLAWLVVTRRSMTLTLLRARGASLRDVALIVPRECAPVLLPAAVATLAAAGWFLPMSLALAATGLLLVGLALPGGFALARHRRLVAGDRSASMHDGAGRRLTVELTLAAATLGGSALLVRAGASAPGLTGVRAVVPTLLAALVGMLVLRATAAALRPLRRRAAASGSAVGLIGLSGLARDRAAAVLPAVLVVVLALAISTFGLVTASSLAGAEPATGTASPPPMVGVLLAGLALAGLGSAVFAVLMFVLAQLGGRLHRAQQHSLLRTLGIPRRYDRWVAVLSWLPLAAIGLVAGVLAGLAVAALALHTVDLSPFTGSTSTPYRIDLVWLIALVGTFVIVAASAAAAETVADRRHRPTADLRAGVLT